MLHDFLKFAESFTAFQLKNKLHSIDGEDNLDQVPELPAIYAVCGRVNGETANCRYLGKCKNLREAVANHYLPSEADACFQEFMDSIKTKVLVYKTFNKADDQRVASEYAELQRSVKINCSEKLNQVF